MDLKVAFTSQDTVPNVDEVLTTIRNLSKRLQIAQRETNMEKKILLQPGFYAVSVEQLSAADRERFGFRELRGQWYRTPNGEMEQSPYYKLRVKMLEDNVDLECRLEARGFVLALHPQMYTFNLSLITLHFENKRCGPFVGQIVSIDGETPFPSSEIEERTGLFGPLVHIQLVEFLAALKREAVPSLYIRDPSGYLEHGDTSKLTRTIQEADPFWKPLIDGGVQESESVRAALGLPDIDQELAGLNLVGEVGSSERVEALEHFLMTRGHPLPDIDTLLANGR
jgi:hypothetical protein